MSKLSITAPTYGAHLEAVVGGYRRNGKTIFVTKMFNTNFYRVEYVKNGKIKSIGRVPSSGAELFDVRVKRMISAHFGNN